MEFDHIKRCYSEEVRKDGTDGKGSAAEPKPGELPLSPSEAVRQSPEWHLVQRITTTPPFQRSAFLTHFLLYICNRKLSHREEEISEYQIGVQALGRPEGYHPGEDNIVRNYARLLRKNLDEYFANEGKHEALRIVIPRGRYVPTFELNGPGSAPLPTEPPVSAPAKAPALTSPPPSHSRARVWLLGVVALAILGFVLVPAARHWRSHRSAAPPDLYARFWQELVSPDRSTYIVTGDSGFSLLQDMTHREIPLSAYINGDFNKWFPGFDASMQRRGSRFDADRLAGYTSVADLNTVVALLRLPEVARGDVIVRNAHDIHMGDIRTANLILLGGPLANPWIDLFKPALDFQIQFSPQLDQRSIVNLHSRPGETAVYQTGGQADPQQTYLIVTFLPNLDGRGHALLIQGLNISGTQAGADFVLNETAMQPILQHARLPDGSIGPFQLVLRAESVGASAPNAHPVAARYGVTAP